MFLFGWRAGGLDSSRQLEGVGLSDLDRVGQSLVILELCKLASRFGPTIALSQAS